MVKYNNILKAIEDYIEKCDRDSPKTTSGIIYPTGEAPQFEPTGKKLTVKELNEIADKMAERYGLEVSEVNGKREVNSKKFILWDNKHKTEINLSTLLDKQDEVDFTNRGYYDSKYGTYSSAYTLDEVLGYYNEMPDMMKDATGGIIFRDGGQSFSTLVEGRINNPICITHPYLHKTDFLDPKNSEYNLLQILCHEGGHAIEQDYTQEQYDVFRKSKVSDLSYKKSKLDTNEEKRIFDDLFDNGLIDSKGHVYSDTKEYDENMSNNQVRFASEYGKTHYLSYNGSTKRAEDFADIMSMVAMSRTNKGKGRTLDGRDFETVKKENSATWKYCEDILDGKIKKEDLTRL